MANENRKLTFEPSAHATAVREATVPAKMMMDFPLEYTLTEPVMRAFIEENVARGWTVQQLLQNITFHEAFSLQRCIP